TQDKGLLGSDQVITTVNTFSLPSPDLSAGWSWRKTQQLIGYGASPAAGAAGVREDDFSYDAQGRLIFESTPYSGGQVLPRPNGGPRAAPPPQNGAVQSLGELHLAQYSYDNVFGNLTQVGDHANFCLATLAYDTGFNQLAIGITEYPNGCQSGGN